MHSPDTPACKRFLAHPVLETTPWKGKSLTLLPYAAPATQILTRKVTTTMSNTSSGSPTIASTCYYLDWITRTCHIGSTLEACKAVASVNSNVSAKTAGLP